MRISNPIQKILMAVVSITVIVLGVSPDVQAQETIRGQVVDARTGDSLPGVNILVQGTDIGVATNNEGEFELNVPSLQETLIITYIGYTRQEVALEDRTFIEIELEQEGIIGDELVVIGYGMQRMSDLTGSVESISTERLQDMPNTNILQGLQAVVPGLKVTNSNSAPGSSPQIRIRGENSLTASNDPLIILDGIPFEGNLNDISTNDIESVSVLKDASAAAVYGARGANGVINITTKRGQLGKPQVNYRGYYGIKNAETRLDLMNGEEYFQFRVDAARNQGNVTDFSPDAILNSAELPNYNAGKETNWQDLVLRTGTQQEHNISVSGGSESTRYYTSLNYFDEKGIMEYSGMKRFTLRGNIDHEINGWFNVDANIQLTNKDLGGFLWSTNEDFGGKLPAFQDALRLSPFGAVIDDDTGRYTFFPEFPNTFYEFTNPFGNDGSTHDDVSRRAVVHLVGEIDFPFLEGLSYRTDYSYDYSNHKVGRYWPSFTFYGDTENGIAQTNDNLIQRRTWENLLKYTTDINRHSVDFTGLFSLESFSNESRGQDARGFINDDNLYHSNESADKISLSSDLTETELVSLMGRFNYNFDSKYLFTGTVRMDGYSGFGENEKYGIFPSGAVSWVLSEETFMQNTESLRFIDFLKIRASVGRNGNMGISPYQTLDALRTSNYVWEGSTANALEMSTVGNPFLRWESTTTLNFGIDYGIFEDRISGSIEYYQSKSNDLIMSRQLPIMNGYSSVLFNVGKTENKGFEFSLSTTNVQSDMFQWTTDLNFSMNRDNILELRGDGEDDLANNWFIGEPLRVHYDYKKVGIWQKDDDIANSHMPSAKPGNTKLADINGDGILDADDRIILGSQLPSWTGGMTNTFSYGNWSLSVFVNTVQGILKQDNILGSVGRTTLDVPYWREDRPSNEYAAPGLTEPVASGNYSDASYVRIKDATFSYTFPQSTSGLRNLRLYVSGQNIYTFTDWKGYDPEASSTLGPFPNSRTLTMGINLGF